jgi:hypothetical protein
MNAGKEPASMIQNLGGADKPLFRVYGLFYHAFLLIGQATPKKLVVYWQQKLHWPFALMHGLMIHFARWDVLCAHFH